MAYQQVGIPRFYVNVAEWLIKNNMSVPRTNEGVTIADPEGILNTLPVNPMPLNNDTNTGWFSNLTEGDVIIDAPVGVFGNKTFIAVLGHNLASVEYEINGVSQIGEAGFFLFGNEDPNDIGNWSNLYETSNDGNVNSNVYSAPFDGFTIRTYDVAGLAYVGYHPQNTTQSSIGSMIIGTYYDMPHSPDLNLTLSYDYSGTKTIETRGGASLSNSFYSKPPMWGDLGAWELSNPTHIANQSLSRSGRKVWDLSFSYLDDGDVFGSNQSIGWNNSGELPYWYNGTLPPDDGTYDSGDLLSSAGNSYGWQYNILTDDNFYSQVIHKTNGGQLPFIFQPNSTDNTNFAICKFDQNKFSFQQTAPNLYSVKCRIREVW